MFHAGILQDMGILSTALHLMGFAQRSEAVNPAIMPPRRETVAQDPLTMVAVFRGVQILQTAISGLRIDQYSNNKRRTLAPIVNKPNVNQTRKDFISETVAALIFDGNAFWLKQKDATGAVYNIVQLPPAQVAVTNTTSDLLHPRLAYSYANHTYSSDDIIHLKFLTVPGRLRGLGPISAAREEITNAHARLDKKQWYADALLPNGILSTDAIITNDEAETVKQRLANSLQKGDPLVLGKGLSYQYPTLKPEDAQFLEERKFDTTSIARLLGIPASVLIAAVEGSNNTYSNLEQEWIQFGDFTLAAYTDDIADAFTQLVPQTNEIRFAFDSLRRSDTKTRMETYQIAINTGILTVNEAREGLGYEPLDQPLQENTHANEE